MAKTIDQIAGNDTFESMEIIDRIAELESEDELDADETEELDALKEFEDEVSAYSDDYAYGVTIISDRYFEDYAQELADSIGAVDQTAAWPLTHIDWESAADELKQDYTSVEFYGDTYWYR